MSVTDRPLVQNDGTQDNQASLRLLSDADYALASFVNPKEKPLPIVNGKIEVPPLKELGEMVALQQAGMQNVALNEAQLRAIQAADARLFDGKQLSADGHPQLSPNDRPQLSFDNHPQTALQQQFRNSRQLVFS